MAINKPHYAPLSLRSFPTEIFVQLTSDDIFEEGGAPEFVSPDEGTARSVRQSAFRRCPVSLVAVWRGGGTGH